MYESPVGTTDYTIQYNDFLEKKPMSLQGFRTYTIASVLTSLHILLIKEELKLFCTEQSRLVDICTYCYLKNRKPIIKLYLI